MYEDFYNNNELKQLVLDCCKMEKYIPKKIYVCSWHRYSVFGRVISIQVDDIWEEVITKDTHWDLNNEEARHSIYNSIKDIIKQAKAQHLILGLAGVE